VVDVFGFLFVVAVFCLAIKGDFFAGDFFVVAFFYGRRHWRLFSRRFFVVALLFLADTGDFFTGDDSLSLFVVGSCPSY